MNLQLSHPMDDLDRMLRRLMQNVRGKFPEYLGSPFEVSELYQTIVPYRHNRRELAIETNQDYELALLRLLAGERGYILGDAAMQDAIKFELAGPNPNTAVFREFAATRVSLSSEATRRYDQLISGAVEIDDVRTVSAAPRPAPPRPGSQPPSRPPSPAAEYATAASAPELRATQAPPPPPPAPARSAAPTHRPAAPEQSSTQYVAASSTAERAGPSSPTRAAGVQGGGCRYCSGALPSGRRVVFCPHCGQNLTVQRCPACSTELELGWKFCTSCGRGVSQA